MRELDPVEVEARLAAYYDTEGEARLSRPLDPRRLSARSRFLSSLGNRGRLTVLEIGSGPGRDAAAFLEAGYDYVGIDLSIEHARRCSDRGAPVTVASARQLPFRDASFDVIWTMSTLMHVPERAISTVLSELSRVLRPGGVAAIGVWGGQDSEEELTDTRHPEGRARLFSRRADERWKAMLSGHFILEEFDVWPSEQGDFSYSWAQARKPSPAPAHELDTSPGQSPSSTRVLGKSQLSATLKTNLTDC